MTESIFHHTGATLYILSLAQAEGYFPPHPVIIMDYRDPPSHTSTVIEEEEPQYDPPSHTSTVLDAEPQYDEYNAEPKVKDKEVIDSSVIPAANKQDPFLVTMSTDDPQHPMVCTEFKAFGSQASHVHLNNSESLHMAEMVSHNGRWHPCSERVSDVVPLLLSTLGLLT